MGLRRFFVPLALLVFVSSCGGCRSSIRSIEVRTFDAPPAPLSSRGEARVELAGAINETLSFCFALRPIGGAIERPELYVSPPTSRVATMDPASFELFRMHRVAVERWPGWHIRSIPPSRREPAPLDVLVPVRAPRGGLPPQMVANQEYFFWVDVAIAKGTSEGIYASRIELRSEGRVAAAIEVSLTVWPVVLPDEAGIPVIAELDHRRLFSQHVDLRVGPLGLPDDWRDHPKSASLDRVLLTTMRVLQNHRLTPVLPELMPALSPSQNREIHADWSHYDAVVEPFLNGRAFYNRVPLRLWPLPTARISREELSAASLRFPSSDVRLSSFVRGCVDHFVEKGWAGRSYAATAGPYNAVMESAEQVRRLASAVRIGGGQVPVATRRFPQDMRALGWERFVHENVSQSVDIWMPRGQFFDRGIMADQARGGRRSWLTMDRPPFTGTTALSGAAADARILPWQALELGAEALHLGSINRWPESAANASTQDCASFDPHLLLYPGGEFGWDEPVASVRLKHLRRGLQDAAYLRLLNEHGLEPVATAVRSSLVRYAGADAYRAHFADGRSNGWSDDPQMFELARRIMADELMAAASGSQPADGGNAKSLARTAAWRRLMAGTRSIELRVDGARVRMRGFPVSPQAEVDVHVTVGNGERTPVTGTVEFETLPAGWSQAVVPAPIEVPAGDGVRVVLTAHPGLLTLPPGGAFTSTVAFTEEGGTVHRRAARTTYIEATPRRERIVIDGDLSDWPPGAGNVAGDFQLISGGPPSARTTAFVLADQESLYVAVNSETTSPGDPSGPRRKGVRYDDLIPADEEDLIEVLIDPLNAGTRSPTDLFHILVKRSGTDVTEVGIGTDPPCGARRPWAADLEVATRDGSRRWIAELRIPLSAFGADEPDGAIWGLNITRWDAAGQELSTWSGATGNAYDPLSLGNLQVW